MCKTDQKAKKNFMEYLLADKSLAILSRLWLLLLKVQIIVFGILFTLDAFLQCEGFCILVGREALKLEHV